MAESKVTRRYADALVGACDDAKNHKVVDAQLTALVEVFRGSDELVSALSNPVVADDDKRSILEALFKKLKLEPMVKNFLLVLLDNDRLEKLEAIAREFARRMDAASGRLRATVISAVQLEKMEHDKIESVLKKLTGRDVVVEAEVDPTLIGGVVTKIGNIVFDGSVKTDLDMLRETLLA